LIIDDEIIFCNALRYHLTQKKYDVEICTSYHEFQNNINLRHFDLVLLDLNLKDIKGIDLLPIVLRMKPDIKIVIVSAHLDHKNILEAKELGAYECTSKNSRMFRVLDQLIDTL